MPAIAKNSRKELIKDELLLPVIQFLNTHHPVKRSTLHQLTSYFKEYHLKKGDFLQKSGEPCTHIYFVVQGVLRGYIVDNKKEVTTWITAENELVASIRGVLLKTPTQENIAALEDCHLLGIEYSNLEKIYASHLDFNIVGRKIVESYYTFAEDRAFICRLSKASDRYNYFMVNNGHLINRIPLMYIASYLNMSIETVSRIRSRLSKKKA
jgi:CRP-like cAMP-binding protein